MDDLMKDVVVGGPCLACPDDGPQGVIRYDADCWGPDKVRCSLHPYSHNRYATQAEIDQYSEEAVEDDLEPEVTIDWLSKAKLLQFIILSLWRDEKYNLVGITQS